MNLFLLHGTFTQQKINLPKEVVVDQYNHISSVVSQIIARGEGEMQLVNAFKRTFLTVAHNYTLAQVEQIWIGLSGKRVVLS